MRRFPQQAIRAVLGLKRLARVYGQAEFESACKKAIELHKYRYKDIDNILKHQLYKEQEENKTKSVKFNLNHFRGENYYH